MMYWVDTARLLQLILRFAVEKYALMYVPTYLHGLYLYFYKSTKNG